MIQTDMRSRVVTVLNGPRVNFQNDLYYQINDIVMRDFYCEVALGEAKLLFIFVNLVNYSKPGLQPKSLTI